MIAYNCFFRSFHLFYLDSDAPARVYSSKLVFGYATVEYQPSTTTQLFKISNRPAKHQLGPPKKDQKSDDEISVLDESNSTKAIVDQTLVVQPLLNAQSPGQRGRCL